MNSLLRNFTSCILIMLGLAACNPNLDFALEQAGENRTELDKVLKHFKNDQDTLKYSAAKFLIENMPYHYTMEGDGVISADSAYLAMAEYPKEQREKVFKEMTKDIKNTTNKIALDIKNIKADYLIKVIDETCDLWHEVAWHKDYSSQLFFDYVLPYRLLDEPLSDWKETVKQMFPSLRQDEVYSKRGARMEIETLDLVGCAPADKVGASQDKYVLLADKGASVSFIIDAVADCQKSMSFRYSATKRRSRAVVKVNDKFVDTLRLDPSNDANCFRTSRVGQILNLKKGINKVCVSFANDTIGLDYVQICSVEKCDEHKIEDYSKAYCLIKNAQNGCYLTFDTLQSSLLSKLEVKPLHKNDSTQMVRLDYLGGSCWSIMAFKKDSIDLCMEVMYAQTDVGTPISQYKFTNANNQKWMVMPLGNGLSRIMSKYTGLFLDIEKDNETGKTFLVQNPYSGAKTQQWKIEKKGTNPNANSQFTFGSQI